MNLEAALTLLESEKWENREIYSLTRGNKPDGKEDIHCLEIDMIDMFKRIVEALSQDRLPAKLLIYGDSKNQYEVETGFKPRQLKKEGRSCY